MRQLSVKSLDSYLKVIHKIRERLTRKDATTPVWFRGHRDSSWPLLPTMYRGNVDPHWERELLRDFRLRSGSFLTRLPTNDLEWLYLMRHHGCPTRILDWSESPLVGLFFALSESSGNTAACVWVLQPWSLNGITLNWGSVRTSESEFLYKYTLEQSGGKVSRIVKATWPVAVRPQHAIHRAIGQSGMFTIHGSSRDPLELIAQQLENKILLQKIEMPAEFCTRIFKELFDAGVTTSSIFPDLDGLAADLRYRYSQQRITMPRKPGAVRVPSAE